MSTFISDTLYVKLAFPFKYSKPRYGTSPFSLICSLLSKDFMLFLFAITAAGVVPCISPKTSHCTSSIVQIVFSLWPFQFSKGILRNQKFIINFDVLSNQRLIHLGQFGLYESMYRLPC